MLAAGSNVHLGGPNGPVISVPGVPVDTAVLRVIGVHAEIEVSGWKPLQRGRTINGTLTGWVALSELTPFDRDDSSDVPDATFRLPQGTVRRGLSRTISASPNEPPFTRSTCQDLDVLEEKGDFIRVRQSRRGSNVLGWMARPHSDKPDMQCTPGLVEVRSLRGADVPPIPEGFVHAGNAAPILARLTKDGGTVHWLVDDEGQYSCQEWRLEPGTEAGKGRLRQSEFDDHGVKRIYRLRATETALELLGPTAILRDRKVRLIAGCTQSMQFVDMNKDGSVLQALPGGRGGARPIAYRPAATHSWFLKLDSCEEAARAANGRDAERLATLGVAPKGCG